MIQIATVTTTPPEAHPGIASDLLVGAPAIAAFTGLTEKQVRRRAEIKADNPADVARWPIYNDGLALWARKSQLAEFSRAGRFPAASLPAASGAA